MRISLIGLPQSGKKTLFKLLTGRDVPLGRRPDESIEGRAQIKDERVDVLSTIFKPEKDVYAENQFVLCPDATNGGDSRTWLDAARRCDLTCLVVRSFESDSVYHPSGSVDAVRDRTVLETELILADLELVENRLTRIEKEKRALKGSDPAVEEKTLLKAREALEDGRRLADLALEEYELVSIKSLGMLTLLPLLCVFNVLDCDVSREFGDGAFTVSALIEQEIAQLDDPEEIGEYLDSLGLAALGADRMNAAAYDALGLMSFYTVGPDEVRAWTIRKGSTAPAAAGKIHSDIERGFIRVEVVEYDDMVNAGSESAARDQGKVQVKGRDHIIEDGSVCHFLHA